MEGTKDAKNKEGANENPSNAQGSSSPSVQIVQTGSGAQKMTRKQLKQKKREEAAQSVNKVAEEFYPSEFYSSYAKYNTDFLHLGVNRIKENIKVIGELLDTKNPTKTVVIRSSKTIRKYVKSLDNDASEFFEIIAKEVAGSLLYRAEMQQARALEKSGLYSSDQPVKMSIKVDAARKGSIMRAPFRREDNVGINLNGSTVNSTLKSKDVEEKIKEAKEEITARIGGSKKLIKDSKTARRELSASTEAIALRKARNFVLDKSNHDSIAKEVVGAMYNSNRGFKSEVLSGSDLSGLIKKTDEYSAAYRKAAEEYRPLVYNGRMLRHVSKDMDRLSVFLRRMEEVIG